MEEKTNNQEVEKKDIRENQENLEYKQKYEELNDKYTRVYAEFENYKKRTEKERFETYDRVKVDFVEKFLPVIDSFEKAKNAEIKENIDKEYQEGIDLIFKQVGIFLEKMGIEEIKTEGQMFDPELHDAIRMVEDSGKPSGMIVSDFRKGYKMGDYVIRHSMVMVQE